MLTVASPNGFYTEFLETLAGVPLVPVRAVTAEEEAYLRAIESATSHLPALFEAIFDDPAFAAAFDEGTYDAGAVADSFDRLLSRLVETYDAVVALDPPSSLQDAHDTFLDVFGEFAQHKDDIVAAAAAATSVDELFETTPQLPDVNEACRPMAEAAFFLGVDVVIACNPGQ